MKVLVPVDGSKYSLEALRVAIDLVQARRSLRVEWYIVILIVFEICLTLYEMIF